MLAAPPAFRRPTAAVVPYKFVLKIAVSKNLIHFHLDIVTGVPVAMDVDRAGIFEDAFHFVQAGVEPDKVAVQAALPDVVERAQFVVIAPDDIVVAAGEKGRVDVNQVHAAGGNLAHNVQVVAPDKAVGLVGRGVAQPHLLHHLHGQVDQGVVLAKALAEVPAFGFGLHGDIAKAGRRAVEQLLLGQGFVGGGVRRFGVGYGLGRRHRYFLWRTGAVSRLAG